MDAGTQLARSHTTATKVAAVLQRRMKTANDGFAKRVNEATGGDVAGGQARDRVANMTTSMTPPSWTSYAVDAAQRSILFWETLWQRGNHFVQSASEGPKPVLHFDYEMVADGRTLDRPVNYALLRITPLDGVIVDDARRPYIFIDPRAGHGPGIGGFKDDSQVGVAMRAGHPAYFVIFFRDPEPGQTLIDVCQAEQFFVQKVRAMHPDSPKPAIIGNCQGGWAAMMLASSDPDATGPIVINGAPMSYWGGAWSEGEGDNPMRYAGGLFGGTWLASLTADLGNGRFDGAHLVQNFENLNPANSLWDKYYHLYDKADTEPPRFLEFERWWGGYYLMNREEIEWITRNLFVGNKLWSGEVRSGSGNSFDLREIKSPIVLFASMGDNITPPQQAFNWVMDVYGSTEEIKARGQVIVGLLHENVGHLGIFVSGKVAKREHTQIVSVLKTIEMLAPGLYAMDITETKDEDGETRYEVAFHERRLEDVSAQLNRFQRDDEQPFEVVAEVSDFNQRGYELFVQPFVQALSNEYTAQLLREWHPLRVQNWAISSLNPWLSWLAPAAQTVRENRQAVEENNPWRCAEHLGAELVSASLDYYRATRDAMTEASFFSVYANLLACYLPDRGQPRARGGNGGVDARDLPVVRDALASIEQGGYVEALARISALFMREGVSLPLSRLELRQELASDYEEYLPGISPHDWRRIRGEQEIIVRYEPEQAVQTLAKLLEVPSDKEKLVTLLDKLLSDKRVRSATPSDQQVAMLERIRQVRAGHPRESVAAAGDLARPTRSHRSHTARTRGKK